MDPRCLPGKRGTEHINGFQDCGASDYGASDHMQPQPVKSKLMALIDLQDQRTKYRLQNFDRSIGSDMHMQPPRQSKRITGSWEPTTLNVRAVF